MPKIRLFIFVLICIVAGINLGTMVPLFSVISYDLNLSPLKSGLVASMTPLGGLIITQFSEKIMHMIGYKKTILVGIITQLILIILLIIFPFNYVVWIIVRLLLGMSYSLIFMPPQVAIAHEEEKNRGLYINLLGLGFGIGLTVGPLLINLRQINVRLPLLILFLLYLFVLIPILKLDNKYPPIYKKLAGEISRVKVLKKIWITMLPAVLFGLCDLSIMSIFPMEALSKGLTTAQTSLLLALFPMAALAVQIPISILSDKFGAKKIAPFLYVSASLVCLIPLISFRFELLIIVFILIGVIIGHGYYFTISYVNSISEPAYIIKANILTEVVYNVFTIFVPIIIGSYLSSGSKASIFLPLTIISISFYFIDVVYNH